MRRPRAGSWRRVLRRRQRAAGPSGAHAPRHGDVGEDRSLTPAETAVLERLRAVLDTAGLQGGLRTGHFGRATYRRDASFLNADTADGRPAPDDRADRRGAPRLPRARHPRHPTRRGDRALVAAIPGLTLLEPDDEQRCCGSGGIYSMEQPDFGDALLASKHAALQRTGADGVVSGNPGCAMQIARTGWQVHHPAQLLARSLRP